MDWLQSLACFSIRDCDLYDYNIDVNLVLNYKKSTLPYRPSAWY